MSRQSGRDNAMTDRPLDNYPTPPWCTDALLEWVMPNVCPELRGPILDRLAPPRHSRHGRPTIPHPTTDSPPKSGGADLSLYTVLRGLQYLLATWLGFCPLCHQLVPT